MAVGLHRFSAYTRQAKPRASTGSIRTSAGSARCKGEATAEAASDMESRRAVSRFSRASGVLTVPALKAP